MLVLQMKGLILALCKRQSKSYKARRGLKIRQTKKIYQKKKKTKEFKGRAKGVSRTVA